jgi:hypothetical protein
MEELRVKEKSGEFQNEKKKKKRNEKKSTDVDLD